MLKLGEVDLALAGGVSESIQTFGIFAGFKSKEAPPCTMTRIVRADPSIKEETALLFLKAVASSQSVSKMLRVEEPQLSQKLSATVWIQTPAITCPNQAGKLNVCARQSSQQALNWMPSIWSVPTPFTPQGDIQECTAIREVFRDCPQTYVNNTKGFIGHAMVQMEH